MASWTLFGTPVFNTTAGTKTVTATPSVGDLIVVPVSHSSTADDVAPTDDNADGLGTYSLVQLSSGTNMIAVYVRNALIGSATSTTVTHAITGSNGGGLVPMRLSGMSRVGTAAVRQRDATNDVAANLPSVTMPLGAVLTTNPVLGLIQNITNPAGQTEQSSPAYTERFDGGYTIPTQGFQVMTIDSGETGTAVSWGANSPSAWRAMVVEFDASVPAAGHPTMRRWGGVPGMGTRGLGNMWGSL